MNEENTAFKPGDLAVLQNATHYHEYNGWLVEILDPPGEKWVMDTRIMERVLIFAYPVRLIYENAEALPRGGRFQCMPWQLRRIEGGSSNTGDGETVTKRRQLQPSRIKTADEIG